eukprot:scaffold4555_cov255-Prasinococcus_capsulatus_cf.AAC.2
MPSPQGLVICDGALPSRHCGGLAAWGLGLVAASRALGHTLALAQRSVSGSRHLLRDAWNRPRALVAATQWKRHCAICTVPAPPAGDALRGIPQGKPSRTAASNIREAQILPGNRATFPRLRPPFRGTERELRVARPPG